MATQGGDIRFTFTGDSSGLNSELKKIDKNLGEVSKATAGASNGLQKGLVRGAKAADKAAVKMAGSISKAKTEMDQASASAKEMGDKMDRAGDATGRVDSSLSAVGGALGQVNPMMGEMAGTAGDAAGALEGVTLAAKSHPAAFAAVTAAVVLVGIAFHEAEQAAKAFEQANEEATRKSSRHINVLLKREELIGSVESAYLSATGQSDEFIESLAAQAQAIQRTGDELIQKDREAWMKGKFGIDEQQARKERIFAANKAALGQIQEIANIEISRRESIRQAGIESEKQAEEARQAAEDAKRAAVDESERQKARAAHLAVRQQELDFMSKMHSVSLESMEFQLTEEEAIRRNAAMKIEALSAEFSALDSSLQKEEEVRKALADAVVATHAEMNNELDMLDAKRADQSLKLGRDLLEADREFLEEKKKDREKDLADSLKAREDASSASLEITSGVLNITRQLEEDMATASIEERERLFNIQKGASIADATINGAVAVTKALAELGPIAGAIAAGAIAATTAAQISLIAGEEPAFDVGGMVRGGVLSRSDDQMSARVLPGEAILNRSATESLGEGGVNALNRGSGLGGVTVVPAYRHFDRFIRDEYRKGGAFRRIVTRERDYPVGQRRY